MRRSNIVYSARFGQHISVTSGVKMHGLEPCCSVSLGYLCHFSPNGSIITGDSSLARQLHFFSDSQHNDPVSLEISSAGVPKTEHAKYPKGSCRNTMFCNWEPETK